MDQKKRFIGDYYRQFVTFSELCARYGVSRRVGYKWLARFEVDGPPGLAEPFRVQHFSSENGSISMRAPQMQQTTSLPHRSGSGASAEPG